MRLAIRGVLTLICGVFGSLRSRLLEAISSLCNPEPEYVVHVTE